MDHVKIWILYSGYGNIGDEAILDGTTSILRDLGVSDVQLIDVFEDVPRKFQAKFNGYMGVERILGSKKTRIFDYFKSSLVPTLPHKLQSGVEGILWRRGGSGYDSYHGTGPLIQSTVATSAIASRFSRAILGGLSMGYAKTALDRKIISSFLKQWNLVLLREPISLQYIKDLIQDENKLYLAHDFSIHVESAETNLSKNLKNHIHTVYRDKPVVGIVLRDYFYQSYYPNSLRIKYFRFIRQLFNGIKKHGYEILLIPAGYLYAHENDIEFIEKLKSYGILQDSVKILTTVRLLSPGEFVDLLQSLYAVVSVRTHAFILSVLANVPAIHLYYEHKGAGILRWTFGANGYNLHKCLDDDTCLERIARDLEDDYWVKPLAQKVRKAREYNKKIIKMILMNI